MLSLLLVIFFVSSAMPSRAGAQTAKSAGRLETELEELCQKSPSRGDVEHVRNDWRQLCQRFDYNVGAVLDSIEKVCEAAASHKKSATVIPRLVLQDWVETVKNAGIDVNQFMACGAVAPTIARLGQAQEYIDAYWNVRGHAVKLQKLALSEHNDNLFRCLDNVITQNDDAIHASKFPSYQRIEGFSAEVRRCATVLGSHSVTSQKQFGLSLGLTITGAALFIGGTGAIIWGSTAVCSGRDAVGDCLDGDSVNQRRLTGWIAGGAGALVGSALGIVGISGLIRADAPSTPQIAITFGPGGVGLQGRF